MHEFLLFRAKETNTNTLNQEEVGVMEQQKATISQFYLTPNIVGTEQSKQDMALTTDGFARSTTSRPYDSSSPNR